MLNIKVTPKTHGATLLARANNKGSWRKIKAYGNIKAAQIQADMINIAQQANAEAEMQKYIDAMVGAKMRCTAAEAVASIQETSAKLEEELTA